MKNPHIFHFKWPTMLTALLVLWAAIGLTGSTGFQPTQNVCWVTAWNESLPSTSTSTANGTVVLPETYQAQFEQAMDNGDFIIMLPSCLVNGSLSVSTETVVGDRVYSGEAQFQIQLDAALSDIDQRFSSLESPSITIWFRILACNVQEVGFCHPLVDVDAWKHRLIPVSTDSSENFPMSAHEESDGVLSTQWLEIPLFDFDQKENTTLRFETVGSMDATIPDVDGVYEFVGHMVVHVMSNERYYRTDIAASLADKPSVAVVGARERPEVLIVETTAKILVGLIIGFSCTVILACFGMIVYFRNHRVMTMAQAGLLGWLTVSCFLTAFLAFLVLPTRDSFCQYSSLAFIPASMTVSIMIGRLFRVYSTLGKAHRLGKNEKGGTTRMVPRSRKAEEMVMTTLSFLAFTRFFGDSQSRTRRASSSLRRTTTRKDSVRLILVLSLPQVVMQIVRVCLYDGGLIFEYDKDLLTARQICDDTGFRWARYAGLTLVLLQYMLCLFIAWCSRDLPAAFNETSKIFKAAMWGGIIVLATVLLQIFFDLPTTSPSLSSIVNVLLVVSVPLVMIFYVVTPKIRRVLSGKEVVVSHLLREMATLPGFGHHTTKKPSVEANTTADDYNGRAEVSKLIMKKGDAVPMEVETNMYKLDEVIGSLKEKILSGHGINGDEIRTFKAAVASLSIQVERVEFDDQSSDDNGVVKVDAGAGAPVEADVPLGQEDENKA